MPLVVSVAGCLIIDEQNRILLQHRTDNNLWSHPGGAVELGESVEEAVEREVYEETNIKLQHMELFNIYSGESQHCIYPNGDEVYFVNVIYVCRDFIGVPIANDNESKEVKFWDLDNLPQVTSSNRKILDDFKSYLSK
ncbi:NUDIX hydrolase [Virgibacillus doumboii]|uniref:NUDIX hydrolase n=1 Tax=Virgibacillus doumboii TaxID=2697503 RepID=UPI0013DEDB68|nr:NUDIX domain-containing protein [Virgibacillus doumboii]